MKEYLEKMTVMVRSIRNNKEFTYSCFEEFVLKNGREFSNHQKKKIKRGKMKECFRNAFHYACDFDLIYVEGFATFSGLALPVLHAWCVDKEGNVFDPTWKEGDEYYGVPFEMDYVRKTILQRKKFGIIDNYEQGFPLLKSEDLKGVIIDVRV